MNPQAREPGLIGVLAQLATVGDETLNRVLSTAFRALLTVRFFLGNVL